MFLKNVLNKIKKLSITARLTLFYSLATILVICAIALFLFGSVIHVIRHANTEFLISELKILTNLLQKNHYDRVILQNKILEAPETECGSSYHYYIRLLDENNKMVLETDGMNEIFYSNSFFDPTKPVNDKSLQQWQAPLGNHYFLIRAPIFNGEKQKWWQVEIALDISHQQTLLNNWFIITLSIISFITLLALYTGFLITRRGMRSLHQLTEKTKNISATSLHQKIDPESWPVELKPLGKSFHDMLERIENSFLKLNQFSADLAHELRTPINNIMGETEIALSHPRTDETYQNLLISNYEELQRISQIIENLLFLARAENHQIELHKTELKVHEEINLLFEFYQSLAEEKNVCMTLEGQATILANSIMFRRMICNLLSNALKYTLDGGKISCRIQPTENEIHITIKDDGIGIAPEHLPNIFDRFYRTDAARSHHSGGTGLGLSIVKSIVELHGGRVNLQSNHAQGVEVLICLSLS